MGLLDAFKQYIADASPGGLLNPEVPKGAPVEVTKGLLGFTPGIGDAISGYDAIQSARQGNYGEAALNGLGLIPFLPSAGVFLHAGHAPKGGTRGVNGEWYKGGKFLPTTDAAKKAPSKLPKGGKVELAPYMWGVRPADDLMPLWSTFRDGIGAGTVRAPKGTPLSEIRAEYRDVPQQFLEYTFNGNADEAAQYIADKRRAADAFNAGARFVKKLEDGTQQYFDEVGNLLDL